MFEVRVVLVVFRFGKYGAEIGFMIYEAFRKISQILLGLSTKKCAVERIMSEVTRLSPPPPSHAAAQEQLKSCSRESLFIVSSSSLLFSDAARQK